MRLEIADIVPGDSEGPVRRIEAPVEAIRCRVASSRSPWNTRRVDIGEKRRNDRNAAGVGADLKRGKGRIRTAEGKITVIANKDAGVGGAKKSSLSGKTEVSEILSPELSSPTGNTFGLNPAGPPGPLIRFGAPVAVPETVTRVPPLPSVPSVKTGLVTGVDTVS
jgi:hypothetical protein